MEDHLTNPEMITVAGFFALTICVVVWQVLRTLSRGALDAKGVLSLACSVLTLGILLYAGHTIFSTWT